MSQTSNANKRRAVSPIVAVLILIVVAVVGGGAIAVLMGQISSQTAQQASTANSKQQAATTISIGGSSTVFPITDAIKQNFTQATGILINNQAGGSGAGMVGVATGVLDVGASSSLTTFTNAQNKFSSANLQDFIFAGSGLVVFSNPALADATPNPCTTITKAALDMIYSTGTKSFNIPAGDCVGGILDGAVPAAAGKLAPADLKTDLTGAWHVFVRADLPSGTVDTFTAYASKAVGTGSDVYAFSGTTIGGDNNGGGIQGNAQLFAAVKSTANSFGFADIANNMDGSKNAILTQIGVSSTAVANPTDPLVAIGSTDKNVETNIKLALAAGQSSNPQAFFPDNGGNLYRYLLYATSGAPSAIVQKYFDFIGSPTARIQINNLGYYTPYDWKGLNL